MITGEHESLNDVTEAETAAFAGIARGALAGRSARAIDRDHAIRCPDCHGSRVCPKHRCQAIKRDGERCKSRISDGYLTACKMHGCFHRLGHFLGMAPTYCGVVAEVYGTDDEGHEGPFCRDHVVHTGAEYGLGFRQATTDAELAPPPPAKPKRTVVRTDLNRFQRALRVISTTDDPEEWGAAADLALKLNKTLGLDEKLAQAFAAANFAFEYGDEAAA